MPLALALAKAVMTSVKNSSSFDKLVAPAILGSYFAWDNKDKISNPFGSAPSGLNTVNVPFGTAPIAPASYASPPTSSSVLQKSFEDFKKSLDHQQTSTMTLSEALALVGDSTQAKNDILSQSSGNSKFLTNQVEAKASLDEVSFSLNTQNIIHSMIYETLDRNLSMISSSLAVSAASTSLSHDLNNSSDLPYVDMDTFYSKLTQSNPAMEAYRLSNAVTVENEIISDMSVRDYTYPEIKKAVTDFRARYFTPAEISSVNTAIAGISAPSVVNTVSVPAPVVNVSVPAQVAPVVNVASVAPVVNVEAPVIPDYTSQMERIALRADSAKKVDDHAHTVRDVKDLDGDIIARAAPMEIKAIREAAQAREKTDIINETFEDLDNPLGSLGLMPLLNFVGRGDTFDVSKPISNLFMPEGLGTA